MQWLESCESTSKTLKEQTKDGISEPVALAAGRQTGGLGRLGRSWVSDVGNLHLSIAIPVKMIPKSLINMIPIAAGVIVLRWIRKVYGIAPCLKWPNDILLDGCKIGGLLCEATYHGSDYRGLIVGIGINLNSSPRFPQDGLGGYMAGILRSANGPHIEVQDVASSLVQYFLEFFPNSERAEIAAEWRRFAIRTGHLWVECRSGTDGEPQDNRATPSYWIDGGIDNTGYLKLTNYRAGGVPKEITINSVNHEHKWSILDQGAFWVADVGNSRTKVALARISTEGLQIENVVSAPADITKLLKGGINLGVAPVIHAVSVNPEGLNELERQVSADGFSVCEISKEPVRVTKSNYDLKALGVDRFAMLEAAQYFQFCGKASWPMMIVGLGTATTVDHLDSEGRHLGGYIVAGLQTSLQAIALKGKMLPKTLDLLSDEFSKKSGAWPHTSAAAMREGVMQLTTSFLKSERDRLASQCGIDPSKVTVILSGGFAELVGSHWTDNTIVVEPNLGLIGVAVLASNGR